MTVVSDSSPLILLSRIGLLEILEQLYSVVLITPEVERELTARNSREPSAHSYNFISKLPASSYQSISVSLGAGERSTIQAALFLSANLVLLDDLAARHYAKKQGLAVAGCIGILESAFRRGYIPSLKSAFDDLMAAGAYNDRSLIEASLANFENRS